LITTSNYSLSFLLPLFSFSLPSINSKLLSLPLKCAPLSPSFSSSPSAQQCYLSLPILFGLSSLLHSPLSLSLSASHKPLTTLSPSQMCPTLPLLFLPPSAPQHYLTLPLLLPLFPLTAPSLPISLRLSETPNYSLSLSNMPHSPPPFLHLHLHHNTISLFPYSCIYPPFLTPLSHHLSPPPINPLLLSLPLKFVPLSPSFSSPPSAQQRYLTVPLLSNIASLFHSPLSPPLSASYKDVPTLTPSIKANSTFNFIRPKNQIKDKNLIQNGRNWKRIRKRIRSHQTHEALRRPVRHRRPEGSLQGRVRQAAVGLPQEEQPPGKRPNLT
jgi:hypothetical protein